MNSATIAVVTVVMLLIGFTLWLIWSDRYIERNILGALADGREWTAIGLANMFNANPLRVSHILRDLESRGIVWSRTFPVDDESKMMRLYVMRRLQ